MKNTTSKSVFGERVATAVTKRRMAGKRRRAFTLVEVIVVLVILAILAAIAIPALTGYIDKANYRGYMMEARQVSIGLQTMLSENIVNAKTGLSGTNNGLTYAASDLTVWSPANLLLFRCYKSKYIANSYFVEFSRGDSYVDSSGVYVPSTVDCGYKELEKYTEIPSLFGNGTINAVKTFDQVFINESGTVLTYFYHVPSTRDYATGSEYQVTYNIDLPSWDYNPALGVAVWYYDGVAKTSTKVS